MRGEREGGGGLSATLSGLRQVRAGRNTADRNDDPTGSEDLDHGGEPQSPTAIPLSCGEELTTKNCVGGSRQGTVKNQNLCSSSGSQGLDLERSR